MHRVTLLAALACAALALPLAAGAARAEGKGDELDRLARRLERDAREMREEVLAPFREREPYRELVRRTQEIEHQAEAIHEMKERGDRPRRVREVLEKIDEELRQLDRQLDELGRARDLDRRAYDRVHDDLNDIRRLLYRMRRELRD
jgi:hypothetical protein